MSHHGSDDELSSMLGESSSLPRGAPRRPQQRTMSLGVLSSSGARVSPIQELSDVRPELQSTKMRIASMTSLHLRPEGSARRAAPGRKVISAHQDVEIPALSASPTPRPAMEMQNSDEDEDEILTAGTGRSSWRRTAKELKAELERVKLAMLAERAEAADTIARLRGKVAYLEAQGVRLNNKLQEVMGSGWVLPSPTPARKRATSFESFVDHHELGGPSPITSNGSPAKNRKSQSHAMHNPKDEADTPADSGCFISVEDIASACEAVFVKSGAGSTHVGGAAAPTVTVSSIAKGLGKFRTGVHVFLSWMYPVDDGTKAAADDGMLCCLPDGMAAYERARAQKNMEMSLMPDQRYASWINFLSLPSYDKFKSNLEGYKWPAPQVRVFSNAILRLLSGHPFHDIVTTIYRNDTPRELVQRWSLVRLVEGDEGDKITCRGRPVTPESLKSAVCVVIQGMWMDEIRDAIVKFKFETIAKYQILSFKYHFNPMAVFSDAGECIFQNPQSQHLMGDLVLARCCRCLSLTCDHPERTGLQVGNKQNNYLRGLFESSEAYEAMWTAVVKNKETYHITKPIVDEAGETKVWDVGFGYSRDPISAESVIVVSMRDVTGLRRAVDSAHRQMRACQALLYSVMPTRIARSMIKGDPVVDEHFRCVSILFCDIANFSAMAAHLNAYELGSYLGRVFDKLDALADMFSVYKIETIGDAYIGMAGCGFSDDDLFEDQAHRLVSMAMLAVNAVRGVPLFEDDPERKVTVNGREVSCMEIRVGVHCGEAIGCVLGTSRPKYTVYGETVNLASRMEALSQPSRVQLSDTAYQRLLSEGASVEAQRRDNVEVKGYGLLSTYIIETMELYDQDEMSDGSDIADLNDIGSDDEDGDEWRRAATGARPEVQQAFDIKQFSKDVATLSTNLDDFK